MIRLLAAIFIKDRTNYKNKDVRTKYGILCGGFGIFLNIVLCTGKIIAGILSVSIALTADALNNLSDAASSLVMLVGFKMAEKKADKEHPFGHGRIEYVSGLVVSFLILLMGVELGISSVKAILSPGEVDYSLLSLVVIIISILIKFYMFIYNKSIGKKIASPAMTATALDSLGDVVATSVVLISFGVSRIWNVNVDGYAGLLVAVFILKSGIDAAKETISPLLGNPPSEELVREIEKIVMAHEPIIGIHDLVVHDYGPGRMMLSLHAEIPSDEDLFYVHDVIDNVEFELAKKLNCEAVIHMDPIDTKNEKLAELKKMVLQVARNINKDITIHDFRLVPGKTHTNMIFDAVIPYEKDLNDEDVKKRIIEGVHEIESSYHCVVNIDHKYHDSVDPQEKK